MFDLHLSKWIEGVEGRGQLMHNDRIVPFNLARCPEIFKKWMLGKGKISILLFNTELDTFRSENIFNGLWPEILLEP